MVTCTKYQINKILINFFICIFIIFIPMKTSVYQISYGLLVLFFLINIIIYKKAAIFKKLVLTYKDILIAFSIIITSMVISNYLSEYANYSSWKPIFHYITRYFLLFLILLYFYKEQIISKRSIVIYIMLSLLFQAFDGIYQSIFSYDIVKHNFGSLSAGLKAATYNRNVFGFFMAIGLIVSTVLASYKLTTNIYEKFILFISFPVFLFSLFFSLSRGSWVFYMVFFILFTILNYKILSKKYFLYLFLISFSTIISFIYIDSLNIRFNALLEMNSSNRVTIWLDTIGFIKENYIFGYGIKTYHLITELKIPNIHNSILEVTFSLGIIGFTSFAYLLLLTYKEIKKSDMKIFLPVLLGFMVMTQFTHGVLEGMSTLSTFSIFAFFIFSKRINPS